MAGDPSSILQEARNKLVEERRLRAQNMLEFGVTAFIKEFLTTQAAIEAVDRAIEDERYLSPAPDVSVRLPA